MRQRRGAGWGTGGWPGVVDGECVSEIFSEDVGKLGTNSRVEKIGQIFSTRHRNGGSPGQAATFRVGYVTSGLFMAVVIGWADSPCDRHTMHVENRVSLDLGIQGVGTER